MLELNEEKLRYGRLLASKNEVEMRNSRLGYEVKEVREQWEGKEKEMRDNIEELEETI